MDTASRVVDLTHRTELTLMLLDDTWAWRQRLLETFEFRSTHHVRVRSSYQIEVPESVVTPFLDSAGGRWFRSESQPEQVRVRLPVTTRLKRPLVGFDVIANDARGYVPLRTRIAEVQTAYLTRLVEASPAAGRIRSGLTPAVLGGVCSFAPDVASGFTGRSYLGRVARYATSGLGYHVSKPAVRRWCDMLEPAASVLAAVLDAPRDRWSSAEQLLFAVPSMDPRPRSVAEIDALVARYAAAVMAAADAEDADLLVPLAEYGRRWELLVDVDVPVGKPFLVKIEEDRPLGLKTSGHCVQRLWLGDAPSYHVEVRAFDPAVILERWVRVRGTDGTKLGRGYWDGRRLTNDAIALYTSDPDRPYFADLWIRLRPSVTVRALSTVVEVLALLAIAVVLLVDLGEDKVGELAVLTIPTSFTMALLAVRENTSLATHLLRFRRARLLGELVLMWLVAIHQLFFRPA